MKKTLFLSAAALLSLSNSGHFAAKPVPGKIRGALVKNIDEPGHSPYPYPVAEGSLTAERCQVNFPPVPAGKRLVVEGMRIVAYIPVATVYNPNIEGYFESGTTPYALLDG
jgi:hypothetical protein